MATSQKKRRSTDERIEALEQEIIRLKLLKEMKKSPARKQAKSALRSLGKAHDLAQEEGDSALEQALSRAIGALEGALEGGGNGGRRSRRTAADREQLAKDILSVVAANPDCSMGVLTEALGEPATALRPTVNELLDSGKLKKKGERRGTRYFVKASRSRK